LFSKKKKRINGISPSLFHSLYLFLPYTHSCMWLCILDEKNLKSDYLYLYVWNRREKKSEREKPWLMQLWKLSPRIYNQQAADTEQPMVVPVPTYGPGSLMNWCQFQSDSEGRRPISQHKEDKQFPTATPPTLGQATCFAQSTDLNVDPIEKSPSQTSP
jgi:hypothetical protein